MTTPPTPRLLSLATALPPHRLSQADVRDWAGRTFGGRRRDVERLLPAFDNAGIDARYSCVPLEWYDAPRGWKARNDLYLDNALELVRRAAEAALAEAGLAASEIDAVVSVSTSGIATPSLDARLIDALGLRSDVQRTPLFGLGCAGGVLGLARAGEIAAVRPGRRVLIVVVELCGLTFRRGDVSKSNVIATALFGDGAAAAVLSTDGPGSAPALTAAGEHTWPDSLDVMGWHLEDDGFGVLFSRDIPRLVERDFAPVLDAFLARHGWARDDLAGHVCHPGGAKVIAALEQVFGLGDGDLDDAREVLRACGNMSAATVLFVLRRGLDRGLAPGRHLLSALGPGFTAGFAVLEAP